MYLIPALGRKPLARLTADDAGDALASFILVGRAVLRRALPDAQRAGLVGCNVAADAAPPYVEHRPITHLTARDLGRLLDAASGQSQPCRTATSGWG